MRPDTSRWRAESAYGFMDDAGVDQLAWECLRRNGDYQRDYGAQRSAGHLEKPLPEPMERRWGLRFCCPATPLSR